MRIYIQQKVFSIGDYFYIKDENENDILKVKGDVLSLKGKKHILTMDDNELAIIYRDFKSLMPKFRVEIGDQYNFSIQKKFSFMRDNYEISDLNMTVKGDFLVHRYDIESPEGLVAQITKKMFSWGDSYVIDFDREDDMMVCICIVLAIDAIIDSQKR